MLISIKHYLTLYYKSSLSSVLSTLAKPTWTMKGSPLTDKLRNLQKSIPHPLESWTFFTVKSLSVNYVSVRSLNHQSASKHESLIQEIMISEAKEHRGCAVKVCSFISNFFNFLISNSIMNILILSWNQTRKNKLFVLSLPFLFLSWELQFHLRILQPGQQPPMFAGILKFNYQSIDQC